jgi:hypothetical protein
MKNLLSILLLTLVLMSTVNAEVTEKSYSLREPVLTDFLDRKFFGLDELDKLDQRKICEDYNYGIYLDSGSADLLPPCLLYQVDRSGAPDSDAGIMLGVGGRTYFLPLKSKSEKRHPNYHYESSDKSISVKMQINRIKDGEDGADYYGTLDVSLQKKTKRYRISYYRGG